MKGITVRNVKLKAIVFGGIILEDYHIEYKDSEVRVWSKKFKKPRRLSIPTSGGAKYPKFSFRVDGEKITADVHRVIAENLIPFTRPSCISVKDWSNMSQAVRDHMQSLYFVNHIDHDKYNCHPSNLEWATPKENCHAYQKHSKG